MVEKINENLPNEDNNVPKKPKLARLMLVLVILFSVLMLILGYFAGAHAKKTQNDKASEVSISIVLTEGVHCGV